MKKIFRYVSMAALFVALTAAMVACTPVEDDNTDDLGLTIKVFAPTVVVPGQPMTINGTGFSDVKEIVFPGDIVVTDFEIVSGEMIRVAAPKGLKQEGTITVRNAAGETAVSRLPLTIGRTLIQGYSAQEGDLLKGNESLTVYGQGMQFLKGAEFVDADGNPLFVDVREFTRVASGRVVIPVPAKVATATFPVKIYTSDGTVVESPAFSFETYTSGGHWEISKRFLWENDGANGAVSWNGAYRFGLDGHDGNNECITTFDQETWDLIKEGTIYFLYQGEEWANVRVTTGWWSAAYGGGEFNCAALAEPDEETGMMSLALNIKEDGNIYDLLDDQHLLFTGSDYTPMGIYVLEEKWIEGEGELVKVRTSFWKNGDQSTVPAASWDGNARFASVSHSTGEETYAFSEEQWTTLKTEPFRIAVEKISDYPNIRITTGWWSTSYMGMDNVAEFLETDEDGVLFMEVNLSLDEALLALLDDQHLLFTGDGYRLLEIYQEKEVWQRGGGEKKPVVFWENDGSNGAVSWNGVYRFGLDGHDYNNECLATFDQTTWNVLKEGTVYFAYQGEEWANVRVTTGWWAAAYGGGEYNCAELAKDDPDMGLKVIALNIKEDGNIYDLIDEQHFLVTGSDYTPMKLYYYP